VIFFDDFIEEWSEGIVRIMGTSIHTDTGVSPLGSREDTLSESETKLVSSVFALFPDILSQALHEKGLAASWEVWEATDIFPGTKVITHHATIES